MMQRTGIRLALFWRASGEMLLESGAATCCRLRLDG